LYAAGEETRISGEELDAALESLQARVNAACDLLHLADALAAAAKINHDYYHPSERTFELCQRRGCPQARAYTAARKGTP
jgi:hypothetical protein